MRRIESSLYTTYFLCVFVGVTHHIDCGRRVQWRHCRLECPSLVGECQQCGRTFGPTRSRPATTHSGRESLELASRRFGIVAVGVARWKSVVVGTATAATTTTFRWHDCDINLVYIGTQSTATDGIVWLASLFWWSPSSTATATHYVFLALSTFL